MYKRLSVTIDPSLTEQQNQKILTLYGVSTMLVHATNLDDCSGKTYGKIDYAKGHYELLGITIEEDIVIIRVKPEPQKTKTRLSAFMNALPVIRVHKKKDK
jgi:hypothetical protein